MNKYKEKLQLSYEALDLIPDLKKFFIPNQTIEYTMDEIEDAIYLHAYAGQPVEKFLKEHYDVFKGMIFNWLDTYEFLDYAQKRFPEILWGHEVIEQYWITEVGDP